MPTIQKKRIQLPTKKICRKRENESKKANNYHHNSNYGSLVAYNSDARRHASSSTSPRWIVSTSAMGSVGASRTITSIGAPAVATGPDDSDWEDTPMLGINIFNQGKEVKTEYKHRLPCTHWCESGIHT